MRNITRDDGRGGVTLCYNETGPGTHVEYMCDNSCNLISTESPKLLGVVGIEFSKIMFSLGPSQFLNNSYSS